MLRTCEFASSRTSKNSNQYQLFSESPLTKGCVFVTAALSLSRSLPSVTAALALHSNELMDGPYVLFSSNRRGY